MPVSLPEGTSIVKSAAINVPIRKHSAACKVFDCIIALCLLLFVFQEAVKEEMQFSNFDWAGAQRNFY